VGHFLEYFTFVLGDFASVAATTATLYPTATLVDSDYKPVGRTIPVTVADHIAFSGMLESGAMASVTWRCGYESSPARRHMVWEIDGEDGVIRIENESPRGAFVTSVEPKMYLNGELVSIEADDVPNNSGRAWLEFAKGTNGSYATYDDAVRIHRLIDAIERSAEGGEKISLK
jgi:predicted dehydrogenase